MELQKKWDAFRANFEADVNRRTTLDNEALRVKDTGVEEHALRAGQRAPDFELPDMAGNKVTLAQLCAEGPLALVFYRGLWSPYCNMEQLALQAIYPEILKIGAQLACITRIRTRCPPDIRSRFDETAPLAAESLPPLMERIPNRFPRMPGSSQFPIDTDR